MRRPPDGRDVSFSCLGAVLGSEPMIDLVYWCLLAALVPIVLHVCVRILSLVYWSFFAPFFAIVLHSREIPVQLPKDRK